MKLVSILGFASFLFFLSCSKKQTVSSVSPDLISEVPVPTMETEKVREEPRKYILVPRAVKVREYFPFIDSLVSALDSTVGYDVDEYNIVHTNPWIIDSLAGFDYYNKREQGQFVYDQKELNILQKGDTIFIPDSTLTLQINEFLGNTLIDLNIPEFKLRIMVNDSVRFTFPVRVGRNEIRYLKTARKKVSLRTPIGEGKIVNIERDPFFVNPVDGKVYKFTKRDDGEYTLMPQIPWLEPMINGLRQGSFIHPTTNPNTLGKAYSNGCVGTEEGAAWVIYYYAPEGTRVRFRYDLHVVNEEGDTVKLKDIYGQREFRNFS